MPEIKRTGSFSRRDLLLGAGVAVGAVRSVAQTPSPSSPARQGKRFEVERFIDDCKRASAGTADAQASVREVFARAIADPKSVLAGVGEPQKGGIQTLYRSTDLTILNIVWAPLMQLVPHEHNMWSLVGIYTGREDNIFWQRQGRELAAKSATAISPGSVTPLPRDVIHSVSNPTEKLTGAIHIYGGDFFAVHRSEWDPEKLTERDWDIQRAVKIFRESNERFYGWTRSSCA
jgi:predicted metal-dependent enzyme (double-stranded beta helix superfamily)